MTDNHHRPEMRPSVVDLIKKGDQEAVVDQLFHCPPSRRELDSQPDSDGSAVFWAAVRGYAVVVEVLLELGANVNCRSETSGATPLHGACDNGRADVVEILLRSGAEVSATNLFEDTGCHQAAYRGNAKIVELLIRSGTDCRLTNSRGNTVLDEAQCGQYTIAQGDHKLVKYLINVHLRASSPGDDDDLSTVPTLDRRQGVERSPIRTTTRQCHYTACVCDNCPCGLLHRS